VVDTFGDLSKMEIVEKGGLVADCRTNRVRSRCAICILWFFWPRNTEPNIAHRFGLVSGQAPDAWVWIILRIPQKDTPTGGSVFPNIHSGQPHATHPLFRQSCAPQTKILETWTACRACLLITKRLFFGKRNSVLGVRFRDTLRGV